MHRWKQKGRKERGGKEGNTTFNYIYKKSIVRCTIVFCVTIKLWSSAFLEFLFILIKRAFLDLLIDFCHLSLFWILRKIHVILVKVSKMSSDTESKSLNYFWIFDVCGFLHNVSLWAIKAVSHITLLKSMQHLISGIFFQTTDPIPQVLMPVLSWHYQKKEVFRLGRLRGSVS